MNGARLFLFSPTMNFVKEVVGNDKGEGGVVCAKNRRGPALLVL